MTEENEKYRLIIQKAGFKTPTLFQDKLFPASASNKYIIAETWPGCGKSLAITVPLIMNTDFSYSGLKSLVIASSAESVSKISAMFRKLYTKKVTSLQAASASPERNLKKDYRQLQKQPDIFIGTPDSIIDHIRSDNLPLDWLQSCVIEDSDIEDYHGFEKDMEFILSKMNGRQNFIVFTARNEHTYSFYQLFKKPYIIKAADVMPDVKKSDIDGVKMKQEKTYSSYIKNALDEIKAGTDIKTLEEIKKTIRKEVPFLMRIWFASWMFNRLASLEGISADKKDAAGQDSGSGTVFVGTGKSRGLFARDLTRLILTTKAAEKSDIRHIKVLDNYSFIEVTPAKAEAVIQGLNNLMFRGRKLNASFARKKHEERNGRETNNGKP